MLTDQPWKSTGDPARAGAVSRNSTFTVTDSAEEFLPLALNWSGFP